MTSTLPDADLHAVAFFLADHAVVESGKAYVNGGFWNHLRFSSFPAVQSFSIVAVLYVPWRAYHAKHRFAIWFEDADAKPLQGTIEGEFQVGAAPDMKRGDPTIMPIAATVSNFAVERPGGYACVLAVDGTEIGRWRFSAIQVFQQTSPSAGLRPTTGPDRPEGPPDDQS